MDIGLNKNSFLYIREVLPKTAMDGENNDVSNVEISDLLKKNQEILIQIVKEPILLPKEQGLPHI